MVGIVAVCRLIKVHSNTFNHVHIFLLFLVNVLKQCRFVHQLSGREIWLLVFDNHSSHSYVKKCFMGQTGNIDPVAQQSQCYFVSADNLNMLSTYC